MEEPRFIHVGFKWNGPPKTKEIETVFNKARDWMRYAPNCWILYTKADPGTWLLRLRPHLTEDDDVFIAELNLAEPRNNYSGWLPPWIWEWIKKHQ